MLIGGSQVFQSEFLDFFPVMFRVMFLKVVAHEENFLHVLGGGAVHTVQI